MSCLVFPYILYLQETEERYNDSSASLQYNIVNSARINLQRRRDKAFLFDVLCYPISFHVFLKLLELGSVVQKPFGDLEQDFVQFRHFPCGQLPCCPGQITLGQSRSRYDLPRNSVLASARSRSHVPQILIQTLSVTN